MARKLQVMGEFASPSNWNAAEGEPGHVLNRTHWVEMEPVDPLAETALTFADGQTMLTDAVDIVVGGTYTVTWNGTEYGCIAGEIDFDSLPFAMLGNAAAMGGDDTGEPFVMMFVPAAMVETMGVGMMAMALDGSTSATVAIRGEVEIVHPLDAKFLPGVGIPTVYLSNYGIASVPVGGDVQQITLSEEQLNTLENAFASGFVTIVFAITDMTFNTLDGNTYGGNLTLKTPVNVLNVDGGLYIIRHALTDGKKFALELNGSFLYVAVQSAT